MQGYNIILVYNKDGDKILMCRRSKEPYKGLKNLVGGKIDAGEDGFDAAYRELFEETGISKDDIKLHHLMDFTYHFHSCFLEVYAGKLKGAVELVEEENELLWSGIDENYFDIKEYAGEGNIGHMIEHVNMLKEVILG